MRIKPRTAPIPAFTPIHQRNGSRRRSLRVPLHMDQEICRIAAMQKMDYIEVLRCCWQQAKGANLPLFR